MASDDYRWLAHQVAVENLVRLPARERKAILETLLCLAQAPFRIEAESFSLPNEAPFYVVPVGARILTLQIDHAVREVRLLAIE